MDANGGNQRQIDGWAATSHHGDRMAAVTVASDQDGPWNLFIPC